MTRSFVVWFLHRVGSNIKSSRLTSDFSTTGSILRTSLGTFWFDSVSASLETCIVFSIIFACGSDCASEVSCATPPLKSF